MGGALERFRGRFGIADLGIDHDVRQVVVEPRRIALGAGGAFGDHRQRLVIDHNLFGRVLRGRDRLGNHAGDRRADVTHPIGRQHEMRCGGHRRAVAVVQHDVRRRAGGGDMRNAFESVGGGVLAGEHGEHAGHGACRCHIDAADARVRVRRAHHGRIGLARKIKVVAVAPASGDEAQILLAAYCVSNP